MLRLTFLYCILLLATSVLSDSLLRHSLNTFQGRIVGGTEAIPGEFPSQLSLQAFYSHICGASVLNDNWALTAAHCVEGFAASDIELLSGTTALSLGGTRHQASRIIIHEDYNSTDSWVNDIAVIEVIDPFEMSEFVQPISLPSQDLQTETGTPATVIGWGRLSYCGPLPDHLQKVPIQIADQEMCTAAYNGLGHDVYPTQICADVPQGDMGSCSGDSGGPLFVDGTVVGLVSWALGCSEQAYPTVYTRVSSYRDWITQNTAI